ncbi:stressosome-associated protein Prli42 [Pseudalkalibacillus berkeleyi]|uniref:Stressosome-associated protein Prli42 n=1 Tax=Pseudalkalibacillus berkeleyi TaxID=1069813 RepID=A0ABS9H148_9BACL|nr:stressosome-associated protein Prli42 [Pseudalkalibacillus berkeleyi]MCF6137806.1 stressosome-associated protein Prli42 [Pseudalkalibacillus berkeleyi]
MRKKWMKVMIYIMIIAMFVSLLANVVFMF